MPEFYEYLPLPKVHMTMTVDLFIFIFIFNTCIHLVLSHFYGIIYVNNLNGCMFINTGVIESDNAPVICNHSHKGARE